MTIEAILAFTLAMTILCASPGPGFFAIISTSLTKGVKPAFFVLLGIVCGDLVYLTFVLLGLDLIADQIGEYFTYFKYVIAIVLLYMALAAMTAESEAPQTPDKAKTSGQYFKSYMTGLMITLGNPKVMLFYIAFLPTFVDMATITAQDIWIIIAIVVLTTLIIEGFYIFSAKQIQKRMLKPSHTALMHKIIAAMLFTAAIFILFIQE